MGWLDSHLHEFFVEDPLTSKKIRISIPTEEEFFTEETIPGWKVMIADCFSKRNKKADYTYDFGDDWQHVIIKIMGFRYCLENQPQTLL